MKKTAVLLTIFSLLLMVAPALAWVGVNGAVYDAYGNPWQHGFTVYMSGTVGGTPHQPLNANGTAIPAGQHMFSVPFLTTPDENTTVSVLLRFNDGGNGRPQSQLFSDLFTQTSLVRGNYFMGSINTGTGPTVINLQSAGVVDNPISTFTGGVMAILLLATFLLLRQRRKLAGNL